MKSNNYRTTGNNIDTHSPSLVLPHQRQPCHAISAIQYGAVWYDVYNALHGTISFWYIREEVAERRAYEWYEEKKCFFFVLFLKYMPLHKRCTHEAKAEPLPHFTARGKNVWEKYQAIYTIII